eukprot:1344061-Alexandrium_andersonii.AAC.1
MPPGRSVRERAELATASLRALVRVPGVNHLPEGPATAARVLVEEERPSALGARKDLTERDLAALVHRFALRGSQNDAGVRRHAHDHVGARARLWEEPLGQASRPRLPAEHDLSQLEGPVVPRPIDVILHL